MLRQQIIRLKNIIVFKIVIAMMCGIFLFWRLPYSILELSDSLNDLRSAHAELDDIKEKVHFTMASKGVVDATYSLYSEALKAPTSVSCISMEALNTKLVDLGKQFRLQHNPVMTAAEVPKIDQFDESQTISILSTDMTISLTSQGFSHGLAFISEAYKILPTYSIITGIHIRARETITPSTLQILTVNAPPELIDTELNFRTREIKVSQN